MEEKVKEKKEMKIPRLVVYIFTFLAGVLISTAFGLAFGVNFALDFITSATIYGVLFIVFYNIFDKVDRYRYRLTPKYWILIMLIVFCDFMFLFTSRSETIDVMLLRLAFWLVSLILTVCFAYFVYKPSQIELHLTVRDNTIEAISNYLAAHGSLTSRQAAEGIVALLEECKKNPIKEDEDEKEGDK